NANCEDWVGAPARQGRLARDAFDFIIEADRFTAALDPTLTDIRYCYDAKEMVDLPSDRRFKVEDVFRSYLATRLIFTDPLVEAPEAMKREPLGPTHPLDAQVTPAQRDTGWPWSIGPFHHLAALSGTASHESYRSRLEAQVERLGGELEAVAS